MKLWKLTQGDAAGYDTYDACVVAAPDAASAKRIHPNGDVWKDPRPGVPFPSEWQRGEPRGYGLSWARTPASVTARCIGAAGPGVAQGVIVASFNAG